MKIDLGPLSLAALDDEWRFTLSDPQEMLLELPSDYEELLANRLGDFRKNAEPPPVVMDLENVPAISSRQLGLMLALRKVCDTWSGKARIVNIGPAVRRLLNLTRTEQFFELEGESAA